MLTQATLPRIFISYSRDDFPFVRQLADDLRRTLGSDETVWYDARLRGGDEWWPMIVEELGRATICLVVCSPAAMESAWVKDEINIAWRRKNSPSKLRIIPLRYQPCQLRADLASLHIIDFLAPRSYQNAFQELLLALNILPSKSISPPSFTAPTSTVRSKQPSDAIYEPDHNSKQQQTVSEPKALLEEKTPTSPKSLDLGAPLQEKVQPSHREDAHQLQSRPLPPPSQPKKSEVDNTASLMKPLDTTRHNQNRQKVPSAQQLAMLITAIVVIMLVVGSIIYFPGYLQPVSPVTSSTATASVQSAQAAQTATVLQASPGASAAIHAAKQRELSALTKAAPTIRGFRAADKWSITPATTASSCTLNADNTYTVKINLAGQYNPCLAQIPVLTNLVMQVTMKIQGDIGGIIFRSIGQFKIGYYRLSVNQSDGTTPTMDTFSLSRCDYLSCADNEVNTGVWLTNNTTTSVHMDRTKPVTLTLVARGNTFDVFINGQFVAFITDHTFTTARPGRIGVYAASVKANTTVTFSDLKVWDLGDHPPAQPKNTPTSQPTAAIGS